MSRNVVTEGEAEVNSVAPECRVLSKPKLAFLGLYVRNAPGLQISYPQIRLSARAI